MSNRDIVAIGTSAGGVEALMYLAERFRPDFPATVLVTIHLPRQSKSSLDELLSSAGPLKAMFARDGAPLRKGQIYIAPPDRHLLVVDNQVRLGTGPRENNARPAIDPMLRSAAVCCCGRSIGVVLTGTLGDGASGLWAIDQCGGMTVVQDPRTATYSEMPQTALDRLAPDHIVALEKIPMLLDALVHQPAGESKPIPASMRVEVDTARDGFDRLRNMDSIGRRSVFSCPDCGGTTWEIADGDLTRFRCHVGHTYTAELMSVALEENLRRALAIAKRTLEERVALAQKLHRQARDRGQQHLAENWAIKAREFEKEMSVIRDSIDRMDDITAREELRRTA